MPQHDHVGAFGTATAVFRTEAGGLSAELDPDGTSAALTAPR